MQECIEPTGTTESASANEAWRWMLVDVGGCWWMLVDGNVMKWRKEEENGMECSAPKAVLRFKAPAGLEDFLHFPPILFCPSLTTTTTTTTLS
jgi:hypothetical protein